MLETIVTILSAATLAVLGWAFQISDRMTTIEQDHKGLRELINQRFNEVDRRLESIEDKL